MAILINGKLYQHWKQARELVMIFRQQSRQIRHWIPTSAVAPDRYILIAGYGDPWSHRVLMARRLIGLENTIPLVTVHTKLTDQGWQLEQPFSEIDFKADFLYQLYQLYDDTFTGRVTVPLLWDNETQTVINNESSDLVRLLNAEFRHFGDSNLDLYSSKHQHLIDRLNWFIFDNINNGVYKVGFATNQRLYEKCIEALFFAFDELDERLAHSRFLCGGQLTDADIRLFATLIRFDTVYYPYLKCNKHRLQDYENLWPYTRDIYQYPGIRETVNFTAIRETYHGFNFLNPTNVIPRGPTIDFDEPIQVSEYELYSAPF